MAFKKTIQSVGKSALKGAEAVGNLGLKSFAGAGQGVDKLVKAIGHAMPKGSRPGELGGANTKATMKPALPNLPFKREPMKRQADLRKMIDEI